MKKIFIVTILALYSCAITQAQSKFAHVNIQDVMLSMPEFQKAQADVDSIQREYEADLKLMQIEYQKKKEELQKLPEEKTENIKQHQQDLEDMYEKIEQCYVDNQEALTKIANDKMQAISTKVREAIKSIGQENSYVYIMDINNGVIYINTSLSTDVTAKVKTKLGLK